MSKIPMSAVPSSFAVRPLRKGQKAKDRMTCGTCGLSWDDAKSTSWTPVPSGRCPFEYFHRYDDEHVTQVLLDFIFRQGKKHMYVDARGYWLDVASEESDKVERYVNISKWSRKDLLDLARSAFGYRG